MTKDAHRCRGPYERMCDACRARVDAAHEALKKLCDAVFCGRGPGCTRPGCRCCCHNPKHPAYEAAREVHVVER